MQHCVGFAYIMITVDVGESAEAVDWAIEIHFEVRERLSSSTNGHELQDSSLIPYGHLFIYAKK